MQQVCRLLVGEKGGPRMHRSTEYCAIRYMCQEDENPSARFRNQRSGEMGNVITEQVWIHQLLYPREVFPKPENSGEDERKIFFYLINDRPTASSDRPQSYTYLPPHISLFPPPFSSFESSLHYLSFELSNFSGIRHRHSPYSGTPRAIEDPIVRTTYNV